MLLKKHSDVRQLNERVHGGISLTVPTGFGTEYGADCADRYYTDDHSLVYVAVTPAVSYRLNEQWSFGAAMGIDYTLSESEVALNTLGGPDGKLKAELDGIGTNFVLSALWEMSERTHFGLPLDRMWGVGGGVQVSRNDGSLVDINVNLINYGKGKVDAGPASVRGRVVGEIEDPCLLVLDVAYHFWSSLEWLPFSAGRPVSRPAAMAFAFQGESNG